MHDGRDELVFFDASTGPKLRNPVMSCEEFLLSNCSVKCYSHCEV